MNRQSRNTPLILAIRCSAIDAVNPISEIDKILAQHATAWFAKYGRSMTKAVTRKLGATKIEAYVLLAYRDRDGLQQASYALLGSSNGRPKDRRLFPAYYSSVAARIGTWLHLARATLPDLRVENVVVRTSGQGLQKAMNSSMSGHFWCRFRMADE